MDRNQDHADLKQEIESLLQQIRSFDRIRYCKSVCKSAALKQEGNMALKNKKFEQALDLYNEVSTV